MNQPACVTLSRPDDWHLHVRDQDILKAVVPFSAAHFGRALIMPNLLPPITTAEQARNYRERILSARPADSDFTPLMTLYLTEDTEVSDVIRAAQTGFVKAVKLYPAGATTNAQSGVRNLDKVTPVFEAMADIGLTLCIHGELADPAIDIFDREAKFIEDVLDPLRQKIPELNITLEHVTTQDGVDYVGAAEKNLAATITPHHLILNRNDLLAGGIRPHYYCLPIVKRERHRQALIGAAISGDRRFFLGTDSAPHPDGAKQSPCGCAGIFCAPNTLPCLAHCFERYEALDRLEGFCSLYGPAHYRLPANQDMIRLVKQADPVDYPQQITLDGDLITVFDPGFPLYWRVESAHGAPA